MKFYSRYLLIFTGMTLMFNACTAGEPTQRGGIFNFNSLSLGGEITGLTGSMTIANEDDEIVTASFTEPRFKFSKPYFPDTPYSLSIVAKPSVQRCSIAEPEGTFLEQDILSISVSCQNKEWMHANDPTDSLGLPTVSASTVPALALSKNGDAIMMWVDSNTGKLVKTEKREGIWDTQPAEPISLGTSTVINPTLAMDAHGNAVLVWIQSSRVFKSQYLNGQWSHPATITDSISPQGTGIPFDPKVAMNDAGDALVVWSQQTAPGSADIKVYKSEFKNEVWTHPSSASDYVQAPGRNAFPLVALAKNGDAVIAWVTTLNNKFSVYITDRRGATWSTPVRSSLEYNSAELGNPKNMSINAQGRTLIAWGSTDINNFTHIYKSEYREGAWTHGVEFAPHLTTSLARPVPIVAVSDNDTALITWTQSDGTKINAYFAEFNGTSWREPTSLADRASYNDSATSVTRVVMNHSGDAIFLWTQMHSNFVRIYMREKRDGTWRNPESYADFVSAGNGSVSEPLIALNDEGDAVLTWFQSGVFRSEFR